MKKKNFNIFDHFFLFIPVFTGSVGAVLLYIGLYQQHSLLVINGIFNLFVFFVFLISTSFLQDKMKSEPALYPFLLALVAIIFSIISGFVFFSIETIVAEGPLTFVFAIVLAGIVFINLLLKNLVEDQEASSIGYNNPVLIKALMVSTILSSVGMFFKGFNIFVAEIFISYLLLIFIFILLLETFIWTIWKIIRGIKPLEILPLFVSGTLLQGVNPIKALFDAIELKSGMTFRSLWTIKFTQKAFGPVLIIAIIVLWLMTGLVQINYDQQGIVYQWGKVQEDNILKAGIHWIGPWPFGRAEKYPTYKIQNFPVGFDQEITGTGDFVWSRGHRRQATIFSVGGDGIERRTTGILSDPEFLFLLGNGTELVAVNIIVTYKIDDVLAYALNFQNPEGALSGWLYQLILQQIVATNIDTLLEENQAFVRKLATDIDEISQKRRLGLQVINIDLVGIHPPVDIADAYQNVVSARINRQTELNTAYADQQWRIPNAEIFRDNLSSRETIASIEKINLATRESLVFAAQSASYQIEPTSFKEVKWLTSLEQALNEKTIYIIDEKLNNDKSELWLNLSEFRR